VRIRYSGGKKSHNLGVLYKVRKRAHAWRPQWCFRMSPSIRNWTVCRIVVKLDVRILCNNSLDKRNFRQNRRNDSLRSGVTEFVTAVSMLFDRFGLNSV
jgi:hypothetical protein